MSVRYKLKVRVNVTLEEVTKAWGRKGTALHFL